MVKIVFAIFVLLSSRLEAAPFIEIQPLYSGSTPLYTGQKAYIGYRYRFNASIDLSEEVLPLLEAKGFKKLGEKQIDQKESNGLSEMQVLQRIEAVKPGTYNFPVSSITGFSYTVIEGQKKYDATPLKSEASPITLTVTPFPETGKPAFFNGALGSFTVTSKLISSPNIRLGDPLEFEYSVSGKGELDTVLAPNLCCQPGFSGFFRTLDFPPTVVQEAESKTFRYQIIVDNRDANTVPTITMAFFDPVKAAYNIQSTPPIPLAVSAPPLAASPENSALLKVDTLPGSFPLPYSLIPAIPLLPLTVFGLAGFIILSHYAARKEAQQTFLKPPLSNKLYLEAKRAQINPQRFYALLEMALRFAFYEKGLISDPYTPSENMPINEIRPLHDLLLEVERSRFNPPPAISIDEALKIAQPYFEKQKK